jgi:hypothetical protein
MRFVDGLIAITFAAGLLSAQPEPVHVQEAHRARRLLQSPELAEKAWGAYLAGRLHSDELQNALIEEFASAALLRDSPYSSQEHAFLTALFDAAIEAGVDVPANLLEPFEEGWTEPVLILLARDRHSGDSLLRLRSEKSRDTVWLAANNLLLEKKSERWYEAVLTEINITHRFMVTDPDRGPGIGGGEGGGSCGDGVAEMPKGFPPVTLYTLQDHGERGDVLLVRGPQNVYYRRTVVPTDKQVGFGSCSSLLDRMLVRLGYLAVLRGGSVEETERLFQGETNIQYTSSEAFQREVERSMTAQEQGIREFVQAIETAGMRSPNIRLRIVPEVKDTRRKTKELVLPALADREFDLH